MERCVVALVERRKKQLAVRLARFLYEDGSGAGVAIPSRFGGDIVAAPAALEQRLRRFDIPALADGRGDPATAAAARGVDVAVVVAAVGGDARGVTGHQGAGADVDRATGAGAADVLAAL